MSRPRALGWSTALWGTLVLATAALFRFGVWPAWNTAGGDFANYYTAARLTREGIPLYPAYRDFTWFQKQMDRYGIERQVGGFIPHPPTTALLLWPVAGLSPVTARNVWTLLNLALLALNVWLLSRVAGLSWRLTALLFLATGFGLVNQFLFGQQYLLLLTSLLVGLYLYQRGAPVAAGVAFGSLVAVKYVGALFLLYFAWTRAWRVVLAGAATVAAVLGLTVALTGWETLRVFVAEVLPRHLQGEIQNPFSVYFQSWNSLLRRLFVPEASLNPSPPLTAPALFFLLKNLIFWGGLGLTLTALAGARFSEPQSTLLFQVGLIPLGLLLLAPAGTTYYFVLLTLSVVTFVKLALAAGRVRAAAALGLWYAVLNLPHFVKLSHLAVGWSTPLAYSRLWLLTGFWGLVLFLFRENWQGTVRWKPSLAVGFLALVLGSAGYEYTRSARKPHDPARWLWAESTEPHVPGETLKSSPSVGRRQVVFAALVPGEERYRVYAADGGTWTPKSRQNFYRPALAPDDATLLVETVREGRLEIWLSPGRGQAPRFVTVGEAPTWHPDGRRFAFVRQGALFWFDLASRSERRLGEVEGAYDPAVSPTGDAVAYCVRRGEGAALQVLDLETGAVQTALESASYLERPCWFPDGRRLVFSWQRHGNRDLWSLDLATGATRRLTRHPAVDTAPVWDVARSRLLFATDRGRGLAYWTLYVLEGHGSNSAREYFGVRKPRLRLGAFGTGE